MLLAHLTHFPVLFGALARRWRVALVGLTLVELLTVFALYLDGRVLIARTMARHGSVPIAADRQALAVDTLCALRCVVWTSCSPLAIASGWLTLLALLTIFDSRPFLDGRSMALYGSLPVAAHRQAVMLMTHCTHSQQRKPAVCGEIVSSRCRP